ncbi:MAG: flavodoxin family protein [Methanoregula sp.]|uniref:flavodoxin family protein n=1 Tax=Methanoregula sp. TaxID=2052170 RepID=UPI003BB0ADD9
MTKVIAFNGSPRKKGNTSILIGYIFEVLEGEGIETELIQVGGKKVRGCTACMKCFENKDGHCVFDDDIINHCIDRIVEADGIILGSPVYFLDVTTEMKGLIDRAGFVSMANGGLYQRKAGMAVAAVRRSGGSRTLDTMLHFLLATGMVVPAFPVLGVGREIGDVHKDEEGVGRARDAGKNIAWLLKMMGTAGKS